MEEQAGFLRRFLLFIIRLCAIEEVEFSGTSEILCSGHALCEVGSLSRCFAGMDLGTLVTPFNCEFFSILTFRMISHGWAQKHSLSTFSLGCPFDRRNVSKLFIHVYWLPVAAITS